jgi:hypothetical protein
MTAADVDGKGQQFRQSGAIVARPRFDCMPPFDRDLDRLRTVP